MESRWLMGMEEGTQTAMVTSQDSIKATPRYSRQSLASQVRCSSGWDAAQDCIAAARSDEETQEAVPRVATIAGPSQAVGFSCVGTAEDYRLKSLVSHNGNQVAELAEEEGGEVTTDNLLRLLAKQGERCALTGRKLTTENCAVDHIDPFSNGVDGHTMANIQLIVEEANRAKGTLSNEAFIRLCCDVADWHRCQNGSAK